MKYSEILIYIIFAVGSLEIAFSDEEIMEEWLSILLVYEAICQHYNGIEKTTLVDLVTGKLDRNKACLCECILVELFEDLISGSKRGNKLLQIKLKTELKCKKEKKCKDLENERKMEKCMITQKARTHTCAAGSILAVCLKSSYPEMKEILNKMLQIKDV